MDLTTDRYFGFAEGPIPWSAIRRYCQEHGIIGDQCEDMHYHVSKLDSAYLEHRAKQAKKSQPSGGSNGNERSRIIRPENAGAGPRGRRER